MKAWMQSTWAIPIALAVLSAIGLVSALLADGPWDAVSWVGLGVPVAVCAWFSWRRA